MAKDTMYCADYAIINDTKIKLKDKNTSHSPMWDVLIENPVLTITDGILTVTGKRVQFDGSVFNKVWLTPDNVQEIDEKYIKYGYKNVYHRWKNIKTPYVDGWFEYKERLEYTQVFSKYTITLPEIKSPKQ